MAALPTAFDLTALLSPRFRVEYQRAAAELEMITALVRGFTRGNGFYDDGSVAEDLRAVILSSAARFHPNPGQTNHSITKGPQSASYGVGWTGWNLAELAVLNRYRVTAV